MYLGMYQIRNLVFFFVHFHSYDWNYPAGLLFLRLKKTGTMTALHILVSGHVQGVFYRASAKQKATELNLTGWIKNTPEGKVEAVVCGEAANTEKFMAWCKQGPMLAKVADVICQEIPPPVLTGFTIVP